MKWECFECIRGSRFYSLRIISLGANRAFCPKIFPSISSVIASIGVTNLVVGKKNEILSFFNHLKKKQRKLHNHKSSYFSISKLFSILFVCRFRCSKIIKSIDCPKGQMCYGIRVWHRCRISNSSDNNWIKHQFRICLFICL